MPPTSGATAGRSSRRGSRCATAIPTASGSRAARVALDLPRLLAETRYDVAILCFHDLAAQYLPLVREHSPLTRVVVDTVDVHYVREQREAELTGDPLTAARAAGDEERELRTYAAADAVIVVTDADRDALLAELPGADVHVVPNVHEAGAAATAPGRARRACSSSATSATRRTPTRSHYLCGEILPLVRRELPDVQLTIVGDAPPPVVQQLAGDGVEVTGWVPETEPYLASHRVSVAPLRFGAGMKGKVGEALAAGLPVVTTTIGAEGMVDGDPARLRPRGRRRPAGLRRRGRPPDPRRRRVDEAGRGRPRPCRAALRARARRRGARAAARRRVDAAACSRT